MSRKATKRIALLLGQDLGYSRRVLSGVLSYAEKQRLPWVYHNAPADIRVLPALERWRPHGIVVHLSDRVLGERLLELGMPIVSVTNTVPGSGIPFVDVDSFAVGQMAAKYLLGLGLRSFAYYGSRQAVFSVDREAGYRNVIEAAGYAVENLHADFLPHTPYGRDWNRMDRRTERWLKQLPKPVGILASNDIPARNLCELCRSSGLRVPDEVAILGVDNDVSECRMSYPSLSSIDIPAEAAGREATSLLLGLIQQRNVSRDAIRLPPNGVIERNSTNYAATMNPDLKQALTSMDTTAVQGGTVEDVCRAVGISRRGLERLFRNSFDRSIYQCMQEVRLRQAKRLLLESDLTIAEVADRAGLGNIRRMDRVFQQYLGQSPSDFRARR